MKAIRSLSYINFKKLIENQESFCVLGKQLSSSRLKNIKTLLNSVPDKKGLIWIASSGSSGESKVFGISHEAFFASARVLNTVMDTNPQSIWGLALPLSHVGGLSIYFRALAGGYQIATFPQKWDAAKFCRWLKKSHCSHLSLVPTQVFDLVAAKQKAPPCLKKVLVGGAALHESLEKQARSLGWPLVLSYGMTEAASTVALCPEKSKKLRLLSHIQARRSVEGYFEFRSPSIFSYLIFFQDNQIRTLCQKPNQYYRTGDLVNLSKKSNGVELEFVGRKQNLLKIYGEKVSPEHFFKILERAQSDHLDLFKKNVFTWRFPPHPRKGHSVELLYSGPKLSGLAFKKILTLLNRQLDSWSQIDQFVRVPRIPRKLRD